MGDEGSAEDMDQLIFQAAFYDNEELLRDLVQAYPEKVNYKDKYGRSALHLAAQHGNLTIVDLLLAAGANVNSITGPNLSCVTPLHVAAVNGKYAVVQRLINCGAELLAVDLSDHCALELAQMGNHFEVACLLIDAIETERKRVQELHDQLITACINAELDVVKKILANLTNGNSDAVLNGTTLDRKCALYIACLNGRQEVVAELLKVRGHMLIQAITHDTVLHAAISSQEPVIVEMILKAFTHLVTSRNAEGSSVLHWAAQCGNLEVIKILMEFPYDKDLITRIEDVSGRFSYNFVIDVNMLDAQCRTTLYLAVANSHVDVVKYLLETNFFTMSSELKCPFQIDVYCSGGRTPLMVAAANGNIAIVKLLLDHGADVNLPCGLTDADISSLDGARCIGSGALNEACRIGSLPLVQLLLQRGAIDHDNIALSTAVKYQQDALIRLFLVRLAFPDPDYRVNKGIDFGQVSLNRNLFPSTVFPTTSCMLNWHNASLSTVITDWLIAACLQLNQRLKTSRLATAALTRIDISSNKLEKLSASLFQLPSLRSLNASNNIISEIITPNDNWIAPLLENLSLERNQISCVPDAIFSSHLPNLSSLDVSFNKLSFLPETLWMAPKLHELNVSNNLLINLPVVTAPLSRPVSHLSASGILDNQQPDNNASTDDSISIGGRIDDSNITFHELKRHNVWQANISLARSDDSDIEANSTKSSSTLASLNIANNNLKILPSSLACCCPRLARLNISNNKLTSLGPVECFPAQLRHLDASSNNLLIAFEAAHPLNLVCHTNSGSAFNTLQQIRHYSPNRNPRSRSKSVVRSQRSLSVARTEVMNDVHINACGHKQHTRLESLRTLQLSKNQLSEVPLFISQARINAAKKKARENRRDPIQLRQNLLFPSLTSFDISDNCIKIVPAAICCLSALSTLNLSGNVGIEVLPSELGLLGKLWHLNLKGCALRDPIKSLVQAENYKTVDLIAYLKSILEDSRRYNRLKLMIVGVQGIGKTSLLQQIRLEGTVNKRGPSNDNWSKRMGNNSSNNDRTSKGVNISTVGVDIAEWTFEPKKSKGEQSLGPVTFRTWDFGGQREYYATHQYFLSRRSIYLVVWKITDGEAAVPDIHQWLVNIQARAPNSPVIVVGTHVDQVLSNIDRFPTKYLQNLDAQIRDRFVLVADADKKGIPRVVDTIFVSSKTKYNIRALCNLMYRTAFDIRTTGGKERLLDQKVPASYLAFEKIAVELGDERRSSGLEPVMKSHDFYSAVQKKMLKNYGRRFRDDIEFNHACSFLHENGVILHYEDVTLRELFFLDPQWLCDLLAHVITIREINPFAKNGLMKIDDLQILFKSLKTIDSTINLRAHIISLLHKFEVALTWQSRSLLIPSLLPDEYQLRAGYPGSRILISTKINSWQLNFFTCNASPYAFPKKNLQLKPLFYQRSLDDSSESYNQSQKIDIGMSNPKKTTGGKMNNDDSPSKYVINPFLLKKETVRRVYMMAYIPSGFWSRLITRILGNDQITSCIEHLFSVEHLPSGSFLDSLKRICDENFQPEWLLWQTGIEIIAFGQSFFTVRQFLPLANVSDIHYELVEWYVTGEDGQWRTLNANTSSLIEIILPSFRINIVKGTQEYVIRCNRIIVTRFLALVVDLIDTLLEDWYPSLGTRFVHTSEGRLLVNRLIPCPICGDLSNNNVKIDSNGEIEENISKRSSQCSRSQTIGDLSGATRVPRQSLYAFTIEECILCAHNGTNLSCPNHSLLSVSCIAPDTAFLDLNADYIIPSETIKRGKMIGRGAFGFVFKATIKKPDHSFHDVALKMLEPVEPGMGARATSIAAFKAAKTKWQRDPLQNACRAYCTCRQELNVLASVQHANITSLIGICSRPLALIVELAPLGALSQLLNNYKRSGARLHLNVIQDTASQVAKALEYLHEHHIIYRDLKCENVFSWRFPPPFSSITDVLVKLGDYGISRCSFPSGGAKGFGGTEGFMAPEIMRYNGEQEYTEKVDCFSFAMFLYELISLKLPFDGQEQVKEYILDGGRPKLTPSELLFPCNVLDVMVVCWAAQPVDRPSASQIVSMTTAPEFTHLLDVISLNDSDSAVHSTLSFPTLDENELNQGFEDSIEGEIWLSRSDGSVTVLGCNQYGWLDSKSISVGVDGSIITAMCMVSDSIWMSESTGLIRIYCKNSYTETRCFSIARFLPSAYLSISVISLSVFSMSPLIVLLTLPSSLLLVNGDKSTNNTLISSINTSIIYSSAIVDNANSKQIWVGHCDSSISIYYISSDYELNFSSTVRHEEGQSEASTSSTVSYLLTSSTDQSLVWSAIIPGSKVYQWSIIDRKVRYRLDARKILPSSESISTLDIEADQDGHVTVLSLLDKSDGAQLFIGTSKGVVIVAQAIQMRPLAAFRPYLYDVHSIIALDNSTAVLELLKPRRDTSLTSTSGVGARSAGGLSSNSAGGDFLETVNWMKDRVSETVNRFRNISSEYPSNFGSYIITIGNGYRCLIDRFTDRKHQGSSPPRRESHCAIIWRTDDWIS